MILVQLRVWLHPLTAPRLVRRAKLWGVPFQFWLLAEKESSGCEPACWANGFPYIDGGLFSGSTAVPRFSRISPG
jgi:hypothetical protein